MKLTNLIGTIAQRVATGLLTIVAACAFAPTLVSNAQAQAWPTKPITIVSPYPAGGITDLLSRIVGEQLSKALGQPVLVEDRPGAGGAVALTAVAKAAPDGYTLVMGGSAPSTIVPAINTHVTYDPVKDFEPVGYVAALPIVLVIHPSIPAKNLKEFIAYARANADKINCGHHGVGTGTHLSCVQFAKLIGVKITDVAYKGGPQVNTDLLTKRVQMYFGTLPTEINYVRDGRLRALGIASAERVAPAPEIPTLDEQGLHGLNLDTWNALFAPAGTPKPVLARLSAEVGKILQMPEVRAKIEKTGSVMRDVTPHQLGEMTKQGYQTYRALSAEMNIRVN